MLTRLSGRPCAAPTAVAPDCALRFGGLSDRGFHSLLYRETNQTVDGSEGAFATRMSERIAILHIITGLHTGGAETMLLRLVEQLRVDFEQHVISLTPPGPVAEKITELGVPVASLRMSRGTPDPTATLRLAVMIRRIRPAVVQTWMYHADLIGGLAARIAGLPLLAWNIRNNDLPIAGSTARTRLVASICARLSCRIPSRIVCCSEIARRTHVALGYDGSKFELIPNGFDLERFRPEPHARTAIRTELGIRPNTPLIGLVARLDPQKNHAGFFAAAGILHLRRPDVHFVLAGRDVQTGNPQVAQWVRAAGVEDVTHLLGERRDVPQITAALDLATLTSSWGEAFPNVLGEAMACGVPCVTTDVGDASLIVGDTGRVVQPGDPKALAQAWEEILSLSTKERQTLGEAARARIAQHFEIGAVARRYAALYTEMIQQTRE